MKGIPILYMKLYTSDGLRWPMNNTVVYLWLWNADKYGYNMLCYDRIGLVCPENCLEAFALQHRSGPMTCVATNQ